MSEFNLQSPADPQSDAPGDSIRGTLQRITYFNPENNYTIARLTPEGSDGIVTVVGTLVGAVVGDSLELRGEWKNHPQYGRQMEVESFRPILPASVKGLEKYLGSGLIKGIGAKYAKRMVEKFGVGIVEILDNEPERVREVEGIGAKRAGQIAGAWKKQRSIRDLMVFLQEHDIPLTHAARLYRRYGERATLIVRNNPYQLALDITGIGFRTADAMAGRLGIDKDAPTRIEAGILHALEQASDKGHCFLPYEELIEATSKLLDIEAPEPINGALKRLHDDEKIRLERLSNGTRAVYNHRLWRFERTTAELIAALATSGKSLQLGDPLTEIQQFERQFNFELATQQRHAVSLALQGGLLIVTGGPGTGKTTLVRAVIHILAQRGAQILLAAPTGRAAMRLSESAKRDAYTIHRLLKFNPARGGFEHNGQNKLKADLLIIDETSMLDLPLAFHLFSALEPTTSVMLVGDIDQLPSVGPGRVLGDLIDSERASVVRLDTIFRQAQTSRIVVSAHRVHEGKMPQVEPPASNEQSDFYFSEAREPEEVADVITRLVHERIPKKFGFNPIDDVQVITPMHRGVIGARELNRRLQATLNGGRDPLVRGERLFCVGDKVMQQRNNYDKRVYNGDIGRIAMIDEAEQVVWIQFDKRRVDYEYDELDELQLAYAITVHKAQGSEYKAVVIPVHTQHFVFLQRNLLYTAITRGKKLVCLVGTKKALAMAIHNADIQHRHTALDLRVREL